ncbi:MAG: class I SAM-dependent methyltransferase [Solirubrobacteraceae bacterium]|jgi:SAM-dependent methyltransferase
MNRPNDTYNHFARVYDAAMDDPRPKSARVISLVQRYHPGASSLLELGCGTGAMLVGLGGIGRLTGIDRSPQMLEIAAAKAPAARLIEGDISAFDLGERFDVVICVFDTLNHLTRFEQWQALFACTRAHLHDGGLFVFDVNTVEKLRDIAQFAPWSTQIGATTVIQNVEPPLDGLSIWNVWIVEQDADGSYIGHHERIGELGVELPQIEAALDTAGFTVLERRDETGAPPTEGSDRVHFAARRRAPA